jgi:hypothetical protein
MDSIRRGYTWIAEENGRPVATMSCKPEADPQLWSAGERLKPTVQISKLTVRRSHAGRGIGEQMVQWAGYYAREQYGAWDIMIDVWTDNARLHGFYMNRLGFMFVRRSSRRGYPAAMLFRMRTADIAENDFPQLRGEPRLTEPAPHAARRSRQVYRAWGREMRLLQREALEAARLVSREKYDRVAAAGYRTPYGKRHGYTHERPRPARFRHAHPVPAPAARAARARKANFRRSAHAGTARFTAPADHPVYRIHASPYAGRSILERSVAWSASGPDTSKARVPRSGPRTVAVAPEAERSRSATLAVQDGSAAPDSPLTRSPGSRRGRQGGTRSASTSRVRTTQLARRAAGREN